MKIRHLSAELSTTVRKRHALYGASEIQDVFTILTLILLIACAKLEVVTLLLLLCVINKKS